MRFKLIEVDNRLKVKYEKSEEIYTWGDDNAYPSTIKSIINSSVTAKQCVDLNAKYIYGKGFQFTENIDSQNLVINKRNHTINQLLRIVSREFSEQNNCFLHVNYDGEFNITSVNLLPSTDVRIGKSDSKGYAGKFLVYDNWDKTKSKTIDKKGQIIIDRFNPRPEVILAQMEAAGGISKYKGQILHINGDFTNLYSYSDADAVIKDCDSEFQASGFKNAGLRKGFFGDKIFITKPFADDGERDDFEETIRGISGAENRGVLIFEATNEADVLSDQFIIKDIDSNINDKLFEYTETSTAKNIRKAFGVPSILIEDTDNSVFGNSGELLKQAKVTHWENKEEERNLISEAFNMIFSRWYEPINPTKDWSIKPIITITENQTYELTSNFRHN